MATSAAMLTPETNSYRRLKGLASFSLRRTGKGQGFGSAKNRSLFFHRFADLMDWGTLLGLAGALGTLGLTWVWTAKSKSEFKFAKFCIYFSGLLVAGNELVLIWNSDSSLGWPGIIVASAIGAVVFGGVAAAIDWVRHKERAISQTESKAPAKSAPVLFDCAIARPPDELPPDGRIFTLDVGSPEMEPLGLGERFATGKGQKIAWLDMQRFFKCDLSNLGPDPLFEIRVAFDVNFYVEKIASIQAAPSSGPILTRVRNIRIPALSPGSKFTFYAYNQSSNRVIVDLPKKIQIGGLDQNFQDFDFLIGNWTFLSLPPMGQP